MLTTFGRIRNISRFRLSFYIIALSLSPSQSIYIEGIEDDPVKIWKKLEEKHVEKIAGSRFVVYDELFSVALEDPASPTTLIPKVEDILRRIKGLRPDTFTVDQLDKELATMAILKALPECYNALVSTLLMQKDLSLDIVHSALKREEINRKPRASAPSSSSLDSVLAAATKWCEFHESSTHNTKECKTLVQLKKKRQGQNSSQASQASQGNSATTPNTESAGNASLRSSDASWTVSNDWIVDTGATAHMTPHRHWFVSMVPCKTPIRLADKSIVYSEGKGVVHFAPRDSKLVVAVTDVPYVPLLGCNLFSALHLTQHKEFKMVVTRGKINFMHQGKAVIQATVSESNVAILDGNIQIQAAMSATVDRPLLHRRFCHISRDRLEQVIREKLSTNLKLTSDTPCPALCETCIMGKQHRAPLLNLVNLGELRQHTDWSLG